MATVTYDNTGWTEDANGDFGRPLTTEPSSFSKDGSEITRGSIPTLGDDEWDWSANTLYVGALGTTHSVEIVRGRAGEVSTTRLQQEDDDMAAVVAAIVGAI